jgi:hypothetical protein
VSQKGVHCYFARNFSPVIPRAVAESMRRIINRCRGFRDSASLRAE